MSVEGQAELQQGELDGAGSWEPAGQGQKDQGSGQPGLHGESLSKAKQMKTPKGGPGPNSYHAPVEAPTLGSWSRGRRYHWPSRPPVPPAGGEPSD